MFMLYLVCAILFCAWCTWVRTYSCNLGRTPEEHCPKNRFTSASGIPVALPLARVNLLGTTRLDD